MADTAHPDRATVDQTPDPEDIDRAPATERASKMPSIPGTAMDPKKMIGFAAAAGAIMFTVLALGTGLTGNSTLPLVKPKPALEPAQYDPATVIHRRWRVRRTIPMRRFQLARQSFPRSARNLRRHRFRRPPHSKPASLHQPKRCARPRGGLR